MLPTPVPDPADPLRPVVDVLWDLPSENLTATQTPADDPALTGREFLTEHTRFGPFTFSLPLGRETSVHISIP